MFFSVLLDASCATCLLHTAGMLRSRNPQITSIAQEICYFNVTQTRLSEIKQECKEKGKSQSDTGALQSNPSEADKRRFTSEVQEKAVPFNIRQRKLAAS